MKTAKRSLWVRRVRFCLIDPFIEMVMALTIVAMPFIIGYGIKFLIDVIIERVYS